MSKRPRAKNQTRLYLQGDFDDDERVERLDGRDKANTAKKIAETAVLRAGGAESADIDTLPLGQVRQVFSLFCEVQLGDHITLCTIRKTMAKLRDTAVVVGDFVRVRELPKLNDKKQHEGILERVEPRTTVLTRTDSFKALVQHPIVANATRMMIVVSVAMPRPKWGLVDRMLVAAKGGGLEPIVCLNKIDLGEEFPHLLTEARDVIAHYRTLGHRCEETCATRAETADLLRDLLRNQRTVLAGHSGVGKSSLIRQIAPKLDIRIGEVSTVNEKGKHTTTSARTYELTDIAAQVIDTPGVKLFGLWGVTPDTLDDHFPDIAAGTAPQWRIDSHARIAESLK